MDDSVRAITSELGGESAVARALRIAPSTVGAWNSRDSIPGQWWLAIVRLAAMSDVPSITYDRLAKLHAKVET